MVNTSASPHVVIRSTDGDTPGSAYRAEHSWAIGNQDLHFGWLFSLARNPPNKMA